MKLTINTANSITRESKVTSSKAFRRTLLHSATLIAILVLSTLMASFPVTSAHTPPWEVPTWAYITAQPNPVGVNQDMFLVFWLSIPPPTAAGVGGDRWEGFTIKITKPDGTTENKGPYTSDPTGGTYALYKPTQVGTYTFELTFPKQTLELNNPQTGVPGSNSPYINDTFLASSAKATLTVQEQPIQKLPAVPLPTEYWTRPINQQNTAWSKIVSNWPGLFQTYRVQDDGLAPNSAHIMWRKTLEFGGILGGTNTGVPDTGYYSGQSYEIRFGNAIILQGRLYFNMPLHDDSSAGPYTCVDLATGETLWQKEGIRPSFGQLYDYESPNQHGVIPSGALYQTYRSGSTETWVAYDPFTGAWMYNFTKVPSSGTQVYTKNGEIAKYILNYNATAKSGWLAKWTTAALPSGPLVLNPGTTTDSYQYRPVGKNADMSKNYEWNVTIGDLSGSSNPAIVSVLPDDIILGRSSNVAVTSTWRGTDDPWTMWAISDKQNSRGSILWKKSYQAPPGNLTQMLGYQPIDRVNRVFTMTYFETGERLGYNLDTGDYMWGPVGTPYQEDHAYQYFSSRAGQHAYGELIVGGYGGEVFAYDTKDGTKVWNFNDTSHGLESNWGMVPTFPSMMADGKVFAIGGEHSPNVPLYKDEHLYAIDAYTGEEVWNLTAISSSGLGEAAANMYVADGYLLFHNLYDGQIYCIGKGPSKTTVSAPQLAVTKGSSVMITGTVTDQSPGAKDTAAISDEYMTPWMEYLYMQQPIPGDAKGVTVKLTAIDPNGNTQEIGETTVDLKGNFGIMWKPPVEGPYQITASFEGSESYWPSYDTTYLAVDPAPAGQPEPTPSPTQVPTSTPTATASPAPPPGTPFTTEVMLAIAAVIIVIVVVAAVVLFRRKK